MATNDNNDGKYSKIHYKLPESRACIIMVIQLNYQWGNFDDVIEFW